MIVYNSPYQAEPLITLVARINGHIPRGTQPSHRQYLQRAMCQYKIARVLRQIPADVEPSHLRDVPGRRSLSPASMVPANRPHLENAVGRDTLTGSMISL